MCTIRGYDEIGRHIRFRFWWTCFVGVQVPLSVYAKAEQSFTSTYVSKKVVLILKSSLLEELLWSGVEMASACLQRSSPQPPFRVRGRSPADWKRESSTSSTMWKIDMCFWVYSKNEETFFCLKHVFLIEEKNIWFVQKMLRVMKE